MAEMLVQIGALRKTVALGKINAARKWISNFGESGEKLIVFGWHRQVVEDLAALFDSPKIIGGMKSEDRQAAADKFMEDEDCQYIFCNLKAINRLMQQTPWPQRCVTRINAGLTGWLTVRLPSQD